MGIAWALVTKVAGKTCGTRLCVFGNVPCTAVHALAAAWPAILITGVITAGCTSTRPASSPASGTPSPQLSPADPYRSDGTTFEPCGAFSTDDLTKWGVGLQPYGQAGSPDQPARGCQWNAPDCASAGNGADTCWSLSVIVANGTIADYAREKGAREQTVAGRTAAISTDGRQTCYVTVPAERATVSIGITSNSTAVVDPCAKAMTVAPEVASQERCKSGLM